MRQSFIAIGLFAAVLFSTPASATYNCSAGPSQYYYYLYSWQDYIINPLVTTDSSCWYANSFVSTTNLSSCSTNQPGWEFTSNTLGSLQRTVTVGANDTGTSNWEFTFELDFDDPNTHSYNYISAQVVVTHNGVRSTVATYYRDGTQGAGPYCLHPVLSFNAVNGDTIKVYLNGAKSFSNTHIKVANAHLNRYD